MRFVLPMLQVVVAAALLLASAGAARAQDPFEIQVYDGTANLRRELSFTVHANYTIEGRRTPAYPGEIPPDNVARFTLEQAYGVTDWFEIALYLQTLIAPDDGFEWGGYKLRAKFIAPAFRIVPWRLGLNVEFASVPNNIEQDNWGMELRPILGWTSPWVDLLFNPIVGFPLRGEDAYEPDFEPCAKLAVYTALGFTVGVEYYAGLGHFSEGFQPDGEQSHILFAALDLAPPDIAILPWKLNLAIGRALTASTEQTWMIKAIIGRALW